MWFRQRRQRQQDVKRVLLVASSLVRLAETLDDASNSFGKDGRTRLVAMAAVLRWVAEVTIECAERA